MKWEEAGVFVCLFVGVFVGVFVCMFVCMGVGRVMAGGTVPVTLCLLVSLQGKWYFQRGSKQKQGRLVFNKCR